MELYKDCNGNPIMLERLVRQEPDWACTIIRQLKGQLRQEKEVNRILGEQADAEKARVAELEAFVRSCPCNCDPSPMVGFGRCPCARCAALRGRKEVRP